MNRFTRGVQRPSTSPAPPRAPPQLAVPPVATTSKAKGTKAPPVQPAPEFAPKKAPVVKAFNKIKEEPKDDDEKPAPGAASSQTTAPVQPTIRPPVNLLQSDDWIEVNLGPYLKTDSRYRIRRAFREARFDPTAHVEKVNHVTLTTGKWVRIAFNDTMQRPTRVFPPATNPGMEWLNVYHGGHCTTTTAFVDILASRGLRNMGFNGVYCVVTMNPGSFQHVKDLVFEKLVGHGKNEANVMFELKATGLHKATDKDGTWGDNETAAGGFIGHYSSGKKEHNRWIIPQDLIHLVAVWVNDESIMNIDLVDFGIQI